VPIREKILEPSDRIKVGESQFIFLLDQEDVSATSVPLSDAPEDEFTTASIKLEHDDTIYFQPDRIAAALPSSKRVARDLVALLKIGSAMNGIRNVENLQARVLEMVLEVIPVERAAVLLVGNSPGEFVSGTYRRKQSDLVEPFRISRTIVSQVMKDGAAVMANNISADRTFTPSATLIASQVRSLLCVPLMAFQNRLGLVYVDTADPLVQFDEHHLHLLTAIASITAVALEHARYVEWLEGENQRLQEQINIEHDMVGESPRMREVYQLIRKVAAADATVLIRGESGTGKELVARAIHRNSGRANRPFVAINCAALNESLLESELFGHERGAFTGAITQKKGKFEIADGGTLFLDEIGEMLPALQAKLLRALQEREFERVGGTHSIKVDLRVITATNRNLDDALKAGTFRQDLYYRLNVVSITMPPLRDRREDIPLLAAYFVQKYSREAKRPVAGITPEAHALLHQHDWPGNVRELQNALERAVVLGSSDHIRPEDLPETLLERTDTSAAAIRRYHDAVSNAKRQIIIKAVTQVGGSFTDAAKLLDLHPNYLYRLIKNLDLRGAFKAMEGSKDLNSTGG